MQYLRDWVRDRTGFEAGFKVAWYPGIYVSRFGCILPVGDTTRYIPEGEVGCKIA